MHFNRGLTILGKVKAPIKLVKLRLKITVRFAFTQ